MFQRMLIANRGEIAARVIRAAKALKIQTVAVYSQADQNSPHLKLADQTVCIGPGPSSQSYLNMEAIIQAGLQHQCQAVHPGFGFLSENATFAALCEQYKMSFVGPSAAAMHIMGDKANARRTMKKLGVPVIPGSDDLITLPQAKELAQKIGFPVLLKATAGGGGKGMRVCHNLAELESNFVQASMEAEKAFGNAGLYLEKYITQGRHIEFQILADHYGHVVHLCERECSVQRHHQKLLEESPSSMMTKELRQQMGQQITHALAAIGYHNAGTVEFFFDVAAQQLYFMEMNTRLQVEHPVTEMVTGRDIVQEQIRIAANHPLSFTQAQIEQRGHAMEFRINAEDPEMDFHPTPGTLTKFFIPSTLDNAQVRTETYAQEGYTIPPFYDSMICKWIVLTNNREQTIEAAKKGLAQFDIQGVPTTVSVHQKVLENPKFLSGQYDTGLLKELGY